MNRVRDIGAEQALQLWEKAKLLDKKKADALRDHLRKEVPRISSGRGVIIFAAIGAILVGLGVMLFVASNWENMGPWMRIALLFLAYAVVAASAHVTEQKGYSAIAIALWFLATLVFGANIFLFGQIFHVSLTQWQMPFAWLLGTLAMGYATRSKLHAWLAVPLAILTLGWFGTGRVDPWGAQFAFLFSPQGLLPLLPMLGLALAGIALLVRRRKDIAFASRTWMVWGALLVAVPLVISTFGEFVLRSMFSVLFTPVQMSVVLLCLLLIVCALVWGEFRRREDRFAFIAFALFLAALLERGANVFVAGQTIEALPFFLYVLFVFALAIAAIWVGTGSANASLINIGIVAVTVIIIAQYFSWSFRLLDRSAAFILGGIVLLLLSFFIDRKRRELVARTKRA